MTQRIDTDEVVINGRRYRIPERIVVLDFSSRLSRDKLQAYVMSLLNNACFDMCQIW
jgi:hypothetical protein